MEVAISIQVKYVLILEWLGANDLKTGAALRDRLRKRQVPVEFVECRCAKDVRDALALAAHTIPDRGVPIVHVESHGDDPEKVVLKERAFGVDPDGVRWDEFGRWLAPLNEASRFNTLLVGAACWGFSAAGSFCLHQGAPFVGCIGFTTSVGESSLRDAMLELYRSLLLDGNIAKAVDSARAELHDPDEKLEFTSAARLASMTMLDVCSTILGETGLAALRPHLARVAKLPNASGMDLTESTWQAKLEEFARRRADAIWKEWFPEYVQARSEAYMLDWEELVRELSSAEAANE